MGRLKSTELPSPMNRAALIESVISTEALRSHRNAQWRDPRIGFWFIEPPLCAPCHRSFIAMSGLVPAAPTPKAPPSPRRTPPPPPQTPPPPQPSSPPSKLSVPPGLARRRYPAITKNATGKPTANPANSHQQRDRRPLQPPVFVFGFFRHRICIKRSSLQVRKRPRPKPRRGQQHSPAPQRTPRSIPAPQPHSSPRRSTSAAPDPPGTPCVNQLANCFILPTQSRFRCSRATCPEAVIGPPPAQPPRALRSQSHRPASRSKSGSSGTGPHRSAPHTSNTGRFLRRRVLSDLSEDPRIRWRRPPNHHRIAVCRIDHRRRIFRRANIPVPNHRNRQPQPSPPRCTPHRGLPGIPILARSEHEARPAFSPQSSAIFASSTQTMCLSFHPIRNFTVREW